ncbi:MAG: class I SAM-dependent methyltransferase [Acidimicrobiia bacterium]|nr:class I SAM-dependent methyltransferase [Acidimicrobiia bacterium]
MGCGGAAPAEARSDAVTQSYFEAIADHLGSAYLRYSHTKGTVQEIDWLVPVLGLRAGDRVLDVGCGPGRHAHELAHRGLRVHGVDISKTFVELARADAPAGATFERADARELPASSEYDAVICLCQGAFGMMTADGDDERVIAAIAGSLRPGGRLALSAFNAYFAVKYHEGADFDAESGVAHEWTDVLDPHGASRRVELWTGCYTPRELRMLLDRHGIDVDAISGVEPGRYGDDKPSVEAPEFLVTGRRRS